MWNSPKLKISALYFLFMMHHIMIFFKKLFICFWLCRSSLLYLAFLWLRQAKVSSLWCTSFSLWWLLLLWSTGSGTQAQELWCTGLKKWNKRMWRLEPRRLPLLLIELVLENATSICRQGGFTELSNRAVYHPRHEELDLHNPFLPCQVPAFALWQTASWQGTLIPRGIGDEGVGLCLLLSSRPLPPQISCSSGRSVTSGRALYMEENNGNGRKYFWPLPHEWSSFMMLEKLLV